MKAWRFLLFLVLALFLSANAFAIEWPTLWKAKFTNWEYFNPSISPKSNSGPDNQTLANGTEDNWGIARITSIYDLTDPNQPQVWSDDPNDNHSLRIFFYGLDLAYWDGTNYGMQAANGGAYLAIYEWDAEWDISIVNTSNRSGSSFNGITNGGTLLALFEFTYGIVPGHNNIVTAGRTYNSTNPPQGTGSAYLKVIGGTLKDIFDQDRDALINAMSADGLAPSDPNAIDPEADVFIKFHFGPPGQDGFQLRSEDPAYGAAPEPATIVLVGAGLLLAGSIVRKRSR